MRNRVLSTLLVLAAAACGGNDANIKPVTPPPAGTGAATPAATGHTDPPQGSTDLAVNQGDGGTKLPPAPGQKGEPGRTLEDIRVRVQAVRPDARACYDAQLKKNASLAEGDIVINWLIDPKGLVINVEVDEMKTTVKDAAVSQCIIDVMRKLKFPESAKGYETRASYPFNFRNNQRKGASGSRD